MAPGVLTTGAAIGPQSLAAVLRPGSCAKSKPKEILLVTQ
jgi:hypothetical protein